MLTQCLYFVHICCTPLKTNMTLENPPFEDVFAIKHNMGIFQSHVSFQGCTSYDIICLCEPYATDKYPTCVDDVMAILV